MDRKIGADNWLYGPSMWLEGTDKHAEEMSKRPAEIERHKAERIANGFSEFDWWNFDSFIMGVVAKGVLKFAVDGHGYFPINTQDYEEDTLDDFRATCGAIYYALTEYMDAEDDWEQDNWAAVVQVRYEEAREAMILFAENLGHWWD